MKKIFRFIAFDFLFMGHLQSLGTAGIVLISTIYLLKGNFNFILLITTYLVFQFIFLNDRYLGVAYDKKTNSLRTAHILLYYDRIPFILGSYLFLSIVLLLIYSNLTALVFTVIVLIFGFFYPHYFKNLTKKIPLFKNFYVSLVFSIMVLYPYVFFGKHLLLSKLTILFLVFVFTESMFNQIALDIKDYKKDNQSGLLTAPALFGERAAKTILKIVALSAVVIAVLLYKISNCNADILIVILTALFVDMLILHFLGGKKIIAFLLSAGNFFIWLCVVLILIMLNY